MSRSITPSLAPRRYVTALIARRSLYINGSTPVSAEATMGDICRKHSRFWRHMPRRRKHGDCVMRRRQYDDALGLILRYGRY